MTNIISLHRLKQKHYQSLIKKNVYILYLTTTNYDQSDKQMENDSDRSKIIFIGVSTIKIY